MYYSQYKQDEILEKTLFKGFKDGFYVDVGAYDGISINNTLYFHLNNNWKGINIEPIKEIYEKLTENRTNDININCAVANNDGYMKFYKNTCYTEMLSGLVDTFDERHLQRLISENNSTNSTTEIIDVETKKLETIFDIYNVKHIHYLTIDVEGAEFEVIKSINFDKVFIDVIAFENNYHDVSIPIIKYLEDKNYKIFNTYFDIFMIHNNSQFNITN